MSNMNIIKEIESMDNAELRLGFELIEADYSDEGSISYEESGRALLNLIEDNPDKLDIIERTIIAVIGVGFESIKERMEENKDYVESL